MERKTVLFNALGTLGVPAVKYLAGNGWRVVIAHRPGRDSEEKIKKLENESIKGVEADVSEYQQAEKFVSQSAERFGKISGLVNLASQFPKDPGTRKRWERGEVKEEDWQYYKGNLIVSRNTSLALLKHQKNLKGVSIINIGDAKVRKLRGTTREPYQKHGGILKVSLEQVKQSQMAQTIDPYKLAKTDIGLLTRTLAKEYVNNGVRVNAIDPGAMTPPPDKTQEQAAKIMERVPLKMWGGEEGLIKPIEFLLNYKFITGQVIAIDGGYSLINSDN
jgi:NAD(P)-dependent dehydrogenase (short-subunit alcohol dehydrogenase family)